MTSPARVFAILKLFSEQRPVWHADEINTALAYTRATGYRYVKDLVEAGFLQKVSAGRYSLGACIIELDYQLRRSDPVLLAAAPVMDELAHRLGLDAVLSTLFGMRVIDTYRSSADATLELSYGRGRPRPLFLGAAPKVLLSWTPRPQLLKIYEAHAAEIAGSGMGRSWTEFRNQLTELRKHGLYWSRGELEPGIGAVAVPVLNADGDALAALALVAGNAALDAAGETKLRKQLMTAQAEIQRRLSAG